jgi:hypothetical protein
MASLMRHISPSFIPTSTEIKILKGNQHFVAIKFISDPHLFCISLYATFLLYSHVLVNVLSDE